MKTPYVPHIYGEEINRKFRAKRGWLTAGVACSIAWPDDDVCVVYAGDEYFIRGRSREGKESPPCITIACSDGQHDQAIAKIYRFTSMLSWFNRGYVDVSGYTWGSHPSLYGARDVYSSQGIHGKKAFTCNHMPIVNSESARKALAFWREGKRLERVHDGYAFLSFYKVIESQFSGGKTRAEWITANIEKLTTKPMNRLNDDAAKRVAELRSLGVDVGKHLFDSGRCAVAHASLDGEIVDPDVPTDRKRLSQDLVVMEGLAAIYIRDELKVPDSSELYRTRNRLEPWESMIQPEVLATLKAGGTPQDTPSIDGRVASLGLWPDGPIAGMERMTIHVDAMENGLVRIVLTNDPRTIVLPFMLDFNKGQIHNLLEEGGVGDDGEADVRAYGTYCYNVIANKTAELTIEGADPVDCEVVIPVNMMLRTSPDKAVEEMVEQARVRREAKAANEQGAAGSATPEK